MSAVAEAVGMSRPHLSAMRRPGEQRRRGRPPLPDTELSPSPSLAHREAFFAIKPVDAVDARGLTLLPQQDEQPTISETLPLVGEIAQLRPKLRVWRPT